MTDPMILATDLQVDLGGRRVIEDVTLAATSGSLTAVIGPNGSGKTTLLRALAGLLPDAGGDIRLAGRDPRRSTPAALADLRAYAPQDPSSAWNFTVDELGRIGPDQQAYAQWLRRLELSDLRSRNLRQLSGGQRKSAFLSLVFSALGDPFGKVLLLDEPMTGLDRRRQSLLGVILHEFSRAGAAVIIATHDLDFVRTCDQVVVLADGRLIAAGEPAGILDAEVTREALGGTSAQA